MRQVDRSHSRRTFDANLPCWLGLPRLSGTRNVEFAQHSSLRHVAREAGRTAESNPLQQRLLGLWDNLKAELLATGAFHYGLEHIPGRAHERFREGDFLNAGVWDGDYRQLITILAKYEDRKTALSLLPVLRRDHMFIAVLSAIALAAVDVTSTAERALSAENLTVAILTRADEAYAMPSERPWVSNAAEGLAALIVQLPFSTWSALSGPFWNLWNPKPISTAVTPEDAGGHYVIDDANRVVIV